MRPAPGRPERSTAPREEVGHPARIGEKFTAGRALVESLSLWFRNLMLFLGAGLLAQFPLVLVTALGGNRPTARSRVLIALVQYVMLCLATGTISHSALEQLRGRQPGIIPSLAAGSARTWKLFAALVPTVLLIAGASLFLVVPGVLCTVRWCLVPPIVAAESGVDPRERSSQLTAGHASAILGLLLTLLAAALILMALLVALAPGTMFVRFFVGVMLPLGFFQSFGAVLLAVSYHLLRSEKEGDLEVVEVFR